MLASVVVIVLGAGVTAFISALATGDQSDWAIGIIVAVTVLLVTWMIWYRYSRNRSVGLSFWAVFNRNHREDGLAAQYRPRKVKDGRSETSVAVNKPITAEEARDIKENSANAWVPSRNKEGGKP